MKELFEELVKVWPADSPWDVWIGASAVGVGGCPANRNTLLFAPKGDCETCPQCRRRQAYDIDPDAFMFYGNSGDLETSQARTIIEIELRRIGCYRIDWIWDDEGARVYMFVGEDQYQAVSSSCTQSLLRVAVQAFSEGHEESGPESPDSIVSSNRPADTSYVTPSPSPLNTGEPQ